MQEGDDDLDDLSLDDIDFQSLGSILDDASPEESLEEEEESDDLDEEPTDDDLLATLLDADLDDEDLENILPTLAEEELDFPDDEE